MELHRNYFWLREEFKATSYRETYVKLKILNENDSFKKSFNRDLNFSFKNTLSKIQNFKFFYEEEVDYNLIKKRNLIINFQSLFTKKTLDSVKTHAFI